MCIFCSHQTNQQLREQICQYEQQLEDFRQEVIIGRILLHREAYA